MHSANNGDMPPQPVTSASERSPANELKPADTAETPIPSDTHQSRGLVGAWVVVSAILGLGFVVVGLVRATHWALPVPVQLPLQVLYFPLGFALLCILEFLANHATATLSWHLLCTTSYPR